MDRDIVIRPAGPCDIDWMTELLGQLFSIESDFQWDAAKQRMGLELLLKRAEAACLVAESDGKVIGMATAQVLISTAEGGKKALIEDVVIAEEFRNRGVGSALMAGLEEWALLQGVRRLDLLADRHNTPALDFYHKVGWHRTELIALQKKSG